MLVEIYVVQIRAQNLRIHETATTLSWLQIQNRTQQLEEILSYIITLSSVAEHKVISLLFQHHSESGLLIGYSLIVDHVQTFQDVDEEQIIIISDELLDQLLVFLLEGSDQIRFRLLIGFEAALGRLICLILGLLKSLRLLICFIMQALESIRGYSS